jgi:UDP-2-acetamido-3-amino-2,3-dideoxy-glucuronate N-acetyltransferase
VWSLQLASLCVVVRPRPLGPAAVREDLRTLVQSRERAADDRLGVAEAVFRGRVDSGSRFVTLRSLAVTAGLGAQPVVGPCNDAPYRLIDDVVFGDGVVVQAFTNLYGCSIGGGSRIGPFVEIQRGAVVGARCKIQSHSFICEGVEIGDEVFVGHGVLFINDKFPRATTANGVLQQPGDWVLLRTFVGRGATLGSGAIIMGGIRIGEGALVGAGAVVTRDVAPGETVMGVPARAPTRVKSVANGSDLPQAPRA